MSDNRHYQLLTDIGFSQEEQDADLLWTIDKQDVLTTFLEAMHPSSTTRTKLSVHLQSQVPPLQKIALPSAEAFERMVKDSGLVADSRAWSWREDLDNNGMYPAKEFERHWKNFLGEGEAAQNLIGAISRFVEGDFAEMGRSSTSDVYIGDIRAFKDSLSLSDGSDFCYKLNFEN